MSNSLKITLVIALASMGGFVTVLAALGRSADGLVGFLGAVIIPSMIALVSANKADKAETKATEAAASAEQTVHQTNGRMTELIRGIREAGGTVPEGYENLDV